MSAPSKIISRAPLSTEDATWVKLVQTSYLDPNSTPRTWEHASRTTRPPGLIFDGVGILTTLHRSNQPPAFLLQKQFRPPLGQVTIEFPAGLVDAGETPEECALRELWEETGYTGKVVGERGVLMWNDPGMCDTNLYLIKVEVDMEDERNKNPTQTLEENEFIECFEVPVTDIGTAMRGWEAEGYGVDARVATVVEGMELAKRLGL